MVLNKSGMSKDKKLEKALNFNKAGLKTTVMALFYEEPTYVYNYKQISSKIGAKNTHAQQLVVVALKELQENEALEEVSKGRYRLKAKSGSCSRMSLGDLVDHAMLSRKDAPRSRQPRRAQS